MERGARKRGGELAKVGLRRRTFIGLRRASLALALLPTLQGQTTNVINDGTTVAGLVRLQNASGAGTPPATLVLTAAAGELEAAQSPDGSDFPLSGAWYHSGYSAVSASYRVQADVRAAAAFPEYVIGVIGWLDPATGKGIAWRIVPATSALFQVATMDFNAATFENNDSVSELYQLDGTPALASAGSAWAQSGDFNPALAATVSLTFATPTAGELAAVPGATARLYAQVHQGGAPVGDAVELLTTLPLPTSHRFGYFATWGTSLFPGELIGYLDNLQFVGSLKVENQPPMVAITAPADDSKFHVPQVITVSVVATDPEGRLNRVELYRGETLVGSANNSPATFAVSGLAEGNHAFSARAADELGVTAASSVVHIEMLPPLEPPRLESPQALPSMTDFREFRFRATGLGGAGYRLEGTTDFVQWTSVATGAITGATMEFTVPRSSTSNALMYRVVVLP